MKMSGLNHILIPFMFLFFFSSRRRHTRYIGDWSSDVCSSDELLVRTLATLPFVEQASLSGASEVLFREPAVLLHLGWAPVQIRQGSNGRHRHPEGRQEESLPCHPDTLRDALRRVGESAWLRAQEAGVEALYQRQLVRGKVYAIEGSGLGNDFRLVALVPRDAQRDPSK